MLKDSEVENKRDCGYRISTINPSLINRNLYRIILLLLILALCLVVGYLYISSINQVGVVYQNETKDTVVTLKKIFLKNTVDNFIQELETQREIQGEHYKDVIDQRDNSFSTKSFSRENFATEVIADLGLNDIPEAVPKWIVFIWQDGQTVLYDSADYYNQDITQTIDNIKSHLVHYRIIHLEDKSCLFGINMDFIDAEIKESAARKIKKLYFGNDAYIWVNEVLNYDGGDNYAIRRIHPNLPETEGIYLSTNMEDIKGNLPYLQELEGVKKGGELFFNYYFKELNSDNISEKLTYARLFGPYDWIVAMGVQNNEMDKYIAKTNEASKAITFVNSLKFLAVLLIMVLLFVAVIVMIEQWRSLHGKKKLEFELQFDPLTNAKNRRFGNEYLDKAFDKFQITVPKPDVALMLFDIDGFKKINDRYGHCVGDLVLKEFVTSVKKAIRSSDELFRWGGDEFVGVFLGTSQENSIVLAEKILKEVSALILEIDSELIRLKISIGIAHFQVGDKNYLEAFKRADQAMYLSKAEGGGKVNVL